MLLVAAEPPYRHDGNDRLVSLSLRTVRDVGAARDAHGTIMQMQACVRMRVARTAARVNSLMICLFGQSFRMPVSRTPGILYAPADRQSGGRKGV